MQKTSIHRWWNLVLVAAYLCLHGIPASAGVYADILWGPFPGRTEWPNYASGTRCEFVVHVYTDTPYAYITRVRIQLGGETIKDVRLSGGAFMPYIYIVTRFASTHFADSTNLEIRAEGWDSAGGTASTSRFVTVYNKATLYGRNEWENDPSAPSAGVPPASFWLSVSMHHDISHTCVAFGWTKQMILNDMDVCRVFYVNTHGDVNEFESDWDEYSGTHEYIYPSDVLPVRQSAVGSGYPPFNTGIPPINVAFIDACLTGYDNGFSVLLWPYYNAYNTNWCENQAWVGWSVPVNVDKTYQCSYAFWSTLAVGGTTHEARDEMVQEQFDYAFLQEKRETMQMYGATITQG